VHIDRTPKLSEAKGVTMICFSGFDVAVMFFALLKGIVYSIPAFEFY
jgi:hypothetical protein